MDKKRKGSTGSSTQEKSMRAKLALPVINPNSEKCELSLGYVNVSELDPPKNFALWFEKVGSYFARPEITSPSDKNVVSIPTIANNAQPNEVFEAGATALAACENASCCESSENVMYGKLPIVSKGPPMAMTSPEEDSVDIIVAIVTSTRCYPFAFEMRSSYVIKCGEVNGVVFPAKPSKNKSRKFGNYSMKFMVAVYDEGKVYTLQEDSLVFGVARQVNLCLYGLSLSLKLTDFQLSDCNPATKINEGLPLYSTCIDDESYHFLLDRSNVIPTLMHDGSDPVCAVPVWCCRDEIHATCLVKNTNVREAQYEGDIGQQKLKLGQDGTASVLIGFTLHTSGQILKTYLSENNEVPVYQKFLNVCLVAK